MIESVRSEWHRRTAAVLLRDNPEWSEQRPEVIAWHFEGAREPANAADYRRRSADRALVHVAYLEAIRHAEQGLELLEQVAPSRERTELSLRLTESLGSARFSTSGYSVPDVRNAFERALALCGELGGEIPIRVLWGLWMFQSTTGQDNGASEVIGHLRRRAKALGDPVSLLAAHTAIGALAYYHGDFERALAESRSALDYYSTVEFQAFVRDYGYDIGIYAFAHLTAALLALGYWAESSRVCKHMLAVAERWENSYIMAMARSHAMNMVRAFGDVDATSELVDQQIAQAQEQKLDLWIGPAICVRGWVIARRGDPVEGIAEMKRGLEHSERTGFLVCRGFFLGHLAEAQLAQGDVDAAIASLDRALELCKSSLDRFYEAVLLQLKGECLNAHGDTAGAEAHFRRSLELGRKQRSKSYERLAAQSLARLLDERGEKEASAELLRPIVAWFRAGHQVPGLFDAEVFRESPRPSLQ
jgi:tetratricopeptide (TPR) repeat protein